MKTVETTIYKFSELSDKAKDRAIEKLSDINVDYDWSECTIDEFKEILETIGVSNPEISYSGFWSQGDGLSFTGRYTYEKGCYRTIVKEFPQWANLHSEVKNLCDLQKKYLYRISGDITRNSHTYSHKNTVSFSNGDYSGYDVDDEMTEIFRSIMQEFYRTLEKEYEYQTSREAIIETIEANEYDFTEGGDLWQ